MNRSREESQVSTRDIGDHHYSSEFGRSWNHAESHSADHDVPKLVDDPALVTSAIQQRRRAITEDTLP